MNSTAPTVSVLIATYNKASALHYAIQSVLWQSFEDFELWVIGDGCTDNSAEVVTAFDDPRVNWYNLPENTGYQSEPHNEGLRRARGKYIAYLNHDDIWFPNHLEILVGKAEEQQADFVYSIMQWVLDYAEDYADIPHFPHAPRPPEASATLHLRSIVDEIGYWKAPQETYAVPRAEYFRQAQFLGKRFVFAPMLTVLKFGGTPGSYEELGKQKEYMQLVQDDPHFANRELSQMLARAYWKLEQPVGPRDYLRQLVEWLRRQLVKRRVDPARLVFWQKPGRHIREWHKRHNLFQ